MVEGAQVILTALLCLMPLVLWPLYSQQSRRDNIILTACLVLAAISYNLTGSYKQEAWLTHLNAQEVKQAQHLLQSPQNVIAQLEPFCQQKKVQACYLLAGLYLQLKQNQQALHAIIQAFQLAPEDEHILKRYWQCRMAAKQYPSHSEKLKLKKQYPWLAKLVQ